ncbi:hypothetical protein [Streptomyces sp. NBC_01408]|uniref:effector-associated constant component EACC1 n=1 Tax=Streptomyces sp. NBC_01408 TaxID=2903855 RepID=UPI0022573853|nr:hypothetical protein [Streptomyces sp. NBC_01408]MCX4695503.1 hypothetical protein [Streptomyces sp. NBC_01408]
MDKPVTILIQISDASGGAEALSLDNWLTTHPAITADPGIATVQASGLSDDMSGLEIAALAISAVSLSASLFQAVFSMLAWQNTRPVVSRITLTSSLGGEAQLEASDDDDLEARARAASADLLGPQED